ncbi:MAG: HK97 family phage prohead protease [Pseudomonadota bacterium]
MRAIQQQKSAPLLEAATEVKFCALDLKRVARDGTFEGYASLFDLEDLGRDIVRPGAFQSSLKARGPNGIKMLFQHDADQPIGVWERLHEDARGLFARGRLMTEVAKGREVLSLMRAGAVDGLSIGFRAKRSERDRKTGIRHLLAIDLWEISVVTFPMQPAARVTSVKASRFPAGALSARDFERWLTQDAGLTRREARAIARDGLKGLQAQRDAGADQSEATDRLREQIAEAAGLIRSGRSNTKTTARMK